MMNLKVTPRTTLKEGSTRTLQYETTFSSDESEKSLHEPPDAKLPLCMDSSSAFILALVKRHDHKTLEESGVFPLRLGLANATCMHILTICIQLYIMAVMFIYVIERRQDPLEFDVAERTAMLEKAVETGTMFNTTDPSSIETNTLMVCFRDHSVKYSQSIVIFLWMIKAMIFLLEAFWYTYISFLMPDASDDDDILVSTENETLIEALSFKLRTIFLLCVNVPKVLLVMTLAFMGAKFLIVAQTLSVLIFKSVGLMFVADLDKLVCAGLMHQHERLLLTRTKFHYRDPKLNIHWVLWLSTLVKVVVAAGLSTFFTHVVYGEIASFRDACNAYESTFDQRPIPEDVWNEKPCASCGFEIAGIKFTF